MRAKRCPDCRDVLPASAFHKMRKARDGLQTYCKRCLYKRKRRWEENGGRAKMNAAQLRYKARDPKRWKDVVARYRSEHPEKERCRSKTRKAINSGRLVPKPCEDCGTRKDVQAHHEDYSKPLEVRWLCRTHHMQEHRTHEAAE